jgi:hypothetical protein
MASKERRVEVNDDKTKYMVMSRDLNARRNYRLTLRLLMSYIYDIIYI